MKVKGKGSRCLLEECVKDNYYARFHPHSYHCCKEMKFIPRLDVNFLDSQIVDGRTDGRTNGQKIEPLYRTLLKSGAIKTKKTNNHLTSFLREERTGFYLSAKTIDHTVQSAEYQLLQFQSLILYTIRTA